MKIRPVTLSSFLRIKTISPKTMAIKTIMGISRDIISEDIFIGLITATVPKIPSMLNILLPMRFPRLTALSRLMEANIATVSSGSEVPTATRVRPMTASEIPICLASPVAPVTKALAPTTKKISPKVTHKSDKDLILRSASQMRL